MKASENAIEQVFYDTVELALVAGESVRFFSRFAGQEIVDHCPACRAATKRFLTESDTNLSHSNMLPRGQLFKVEQLTVSGIPDADQPSVFATFHMGSKDYESGPVDVMNKCPFRIERYIAGLRFFYVELMSSKNLQRLRIRVELRGQLQWIAEGEDHERNE